jgi:acyl carrier protein
VTRAQIVQRVTQQVQQVIPEAVGIDESADFRQFAGFDSLSFLEIVAWLEGELHVEVPDGELATERFTTIGEIADYVLQAFQAGVK